MIQSILTSKMVKAFFAPKMHILCKVFAYSLTQCKKKLNILLAIRIQKPTTYSVLAVGAAVMF